ncbi:hypothetical protein AB0G05_26675 [Nonomuraea wenchangensis]
MNAVCLASLAWGHARPRGETAESEPQTGADAEQAASPGERPPREESP